MAFGKRLFVFLLAASCALTAANPATAQDKPEKKAKKTETAGKKAPKPNPAFAAVVDDPALPRVLLIGDSISIGYTVPVREALVGKANVHRIGENGGPTIKGLQKIDAWLGDGHWDVIHFNWGLHDLKVQDGKHQVPIDEYEKNLRTLVTRLKKTGAKLIWCSTTPVPDGVQSPIRTTGDVPVYNAAALKVMAENGIEIDDLYSFALPRLEKIQLPKNVHYSPAGSKVLAGQVAASIFKTLEAAKAEKK